MKLFLPSWVLDPQFMYVRKHMVDGGVEYEDCNIIEDWILKKGGVNTETMFHRGPQPNPYVEVSLPTYAALKKFRAKLEAYLKKLKPQ